jgi:clan AA aspartic protease
MMLGVVNSSREAIIQVVLRSDRGSTKMIRAVVDTGYTGDLMLPRALVDELGLRLYGIQEAILGDGSSKVLRVYLGSVIWDGTVRRIEIHASDSEALVGMGLLENYRLEIEAKSGGTVRITALDE